MKKLLIPIAFLFILPFSFSCGNLNKLNLSQADAALAIRQLLELGTRDGVRGSFTQQAIMETLFPEPIRKTLSTLQQIGLSGEIDRFTNTLAIASEKAADRSIPIFLRAIDNLSFTDALSIIRNGGTAATDYLKTTTGSEVRHSITPVMKEALDEYKLNEQWDKLMKPAQTLAGNKLNLDLANLMAGLVTQKMFEKIGEKERLVRTNISYRTTPLLQKAFSKVW
ncbi:MAG: DUF4197 domain-containing protein [Flavisolibacter sp.]